ncbi:DUF2512 family protein [Virgibacillus dakarensis]|uniref:DUF2512 domain-containing protein n=1 Tax=Lentibacillus populi TaxID=1827502 RepID=A0A9W5TUX6_9BACI|nr:MULTISPECIES: DUF2512 family protein [Bacillaceae]MBT2214215.1 YndM family protein [Virgibacillus dakarensis]MTW85960.1 DUF2512 family protein [Virgibacillus dakarensis]GGB33071.1 hypothetical protein GCM10011409_08110 [Lentibacillus populi]
MSGFIVKLIVCPVGIILASWIFPNVDFAYWYQPIIIGVVLAVIGYFMEVWMLRENTNWLSTAIDFIVASLVVYFGAMLFVDTNVTFWGAVLTGLLIGITEIFQHYWLLQTGRAQKEPVGD